MGDTLLHLLHLLLAEPGVHANPVHFRDIDLLGAKFLYEHVVFPLVTHSRSFVVYCTSSKITDIELSLCIKKCFYANFVYV